MAMVLAPITCFYTHCFYRVCAFFHEMSIFVCFNMSPSPWLSLSLYGHLLTLLCVSRSGKAYVNQVLDSSWMWSYLANAILLCMFLQTLLWIWLQINLGKIVYSIPGFWYPQCILMKSIVMYILWWWQLCRHQVLDARLSSYILHSM